MHTSREKNFEPVTITAVNKAMGHSQAVVLKNEEIDKERNAQLVSKLCGEETTMLCLQHLPIRLYLPCMCRFR